MILRRAFLRRAAFTAAACAFIRPQELFSEKSSGWANHSFNYDNRGDFFYQGTSSTARKINDVPYPGGRYTHNQDLWIPIKPNRPDGSMVIRFKNASR